MVVIRKENKLIREGKRLPDPRYFKEISPTITSNGHGSCIHQYITFSDTLIAFQEGNDLIDGLIGIRLFVIEKRTNPPKQADAG